MGCLMDSKKNPDFLCRTKYNAELPPVPIKSMLLKFEFEPQVFVKYQKTGLEAEFDPKLELNELAVAPVNLLSLHGKSFSAESLSDKDLDVISSLERETSKSIRPTATWLRKPNYVDLDSLRRANEEYYRINCRLERTTEQPEISREDTQKLIQATFEEADIWDFDIQHPKNPSLTVQSVVPFFPDFELWKDEFVQIHFENPAGVSENGGILCGTIGHNADGQPEKYFRYFDVSLNQYSIYKRC